MKQDKISIDKKLSTLKYESACNSHLILDEEKCKKCIKKTCLFVCPARVYTQNTDGTVKIEYENCLECGACKFACECNAIKWNYPEKSKGVLYKFS